MSRATYLFSAIVLVSSLMSASARAAEPMLDGLAEELARLRGEIEVLDGRLSDQRESRRTQLRALAAQKNTVEMELQREELRAKQYADRAVRGKERAEVTKERQGYLTRSVIESAKTLKATLEGSIPFQLAERAAELDAIAKEAEAGTLDAAAALDRLWAWVDAEMKLTKESALDQQILLLDGEEVLSDVARIGMVAIYFRAPGNRFGLARWSNNAWVWETLSAAQDQERLQALFTALERGPAKGFFTLPGLALVTNREEP